MIAEYYVKWDKVHVTLTDGSTHAIEPECSASDDMQAFKRPQAVEEVAPEDEEDEAAAAAAFEVVWREMERQDNEAEERICCWEWNQAIQAADIIWEEKQAMQAADLKFSDL